MTIANMYQGRFKQYDIQLMRIYLNPANYPCTAMNGGIKRKATNPINSTSQQKCS